MNQEGKQTGFFPFSCALFHKQQGLASGGIVSLWSLHVVVLTAALQRLELGFYGAPFSLHPQFINHLYPGI